MQAGSQQKDKSPRQVKGNSCRAIRHHMQILLGNQDENPRKTTFELVKNQRAMYFSIKDKKCDVI